MTSVERARKFLENKGRVIALTVVPLASLVHLAIPAKAALIFDTTTCNISSSGSANSPSGSCSISQYSPGTDGNTGVAMYGTGSTYMSGGSGTLKFDASGGATGSYLGSIPFAWDFNNSIGNGSLSTYDLQLYLNNSLVLDENGALLATVSGSTSLDVSGLGSITSYEILLRTTALANSSGGTFSTTIPGGSTIDLAHQTAAQNTTPEPATVGLTASALAFLGSLAWWRRRKTS